MHAVFWTVISVLAYLTYRRLGGDYVWIFVVKEIAVTMTLFYAVSWLIAKGVQVGNITALSVSISWVMFGGCP